jgi:cytochrome c553
MARVFKWIALGLAALVVVVIIAAVVLFSRAGSRLDRIIEVPLAGIEVPTSEEARERGRHQVHAVLACTECHGDDLAGKMFFDAAPMGRLAASNLTPAAGSPTVGYTAEDWNRAIRHGVNREGRGLLFMPSDAYAHLTDDELGEVVAYLASLEPIERDLPEPDIGPVTRVLLATGQEIIPAERVDHAAVGRPQPVTSDSLIAAGAHLVKVSACVACHGPSFDGGKVPGTDPSWPPAGNLTPHPEGLGRYTLDTFDSVLRTGTKVDGTQIDPSFMPWRSYAGMSEGEVAALWAYLQSLEPRAPKPR